MLVALMAFAASTVHANNNHIETAVVAHPVPTAAEVGEAVTLSVMLKGAVKSIQWRKNGTPIPDATQTTLEVGPLEEKMNPDTYDVLIQDAFGKAFTTTKATVQALPANSGALVSERRLRESIKLQDLFNLVRIFDQASARISEPLEDLAGHRNGAGYYFDSCPKDVDAEFVQPVQTDKASQQALKLELRNCFISKTNALGEEIGPLVTGTLIQGRKVEQSANRKLITEEKHARNLTLRFPHAKTTNNAPNTDFDLLLNGKAVRTIETAQLSERNTKMREELSWASGTEIQNPQTGVKAKILSGKYVREFFGHYQGGEFYAGRETELFNQLKIKLGNDEVTISGMVTKITDQNGVNRNGSYRVVVNGEHMLNTSSGVSALAGFTGSLPMAPKLNGFFINDHSRGIQKRAPRQMVGPAQSVAIKVD